MGACCASQKNQKPKTCRTQEGIQLERVDSQASIKVKPQVGENTKILRDGTLAQVAEMLNNCNDINAYSFGNTKTLLIDALIESNNPEVIEMIIKKGANIDMVEAETGNSPLFITAVDLKVHFVELLLKHNPNINHRNKSKQDIFEYLKDQLIDKKAALNRVLSDSESKRYNEIQQMLKIYKEKKQNEEQLDEPERKRLNEMGDFDSNKNTDARK